MTLHMPLWDKATFMTTIQALFDEGYLYDTTPALIEIRLPL
jgi:hypothetical protein